MCAFVYGCLHATTCVRKPENNFQGSVLFLHCVALAVRTQVIGLSSTHLLSHVMEPPPSIFSRISNKYQSAEIQGSTDKIAWFALTQAHG